MSYIINVCTALADGIRERGQVHGNTKEMIAVNLNIDLSNTNYAEEQGSVADYYGGRFSRRYESEKFHYAQLKFAMLHKVEETAYFFKLSREEATESRKLIIFSNDCISSVQYYNRGGDTGLIVHMRSSDVVELLPIDLLALYEILLVVNETYGVSPHKLTMDVILGSAHVYTSGGRE